jgi:hypothetical protein
VSHRQDVGVTSVLSYPFVIPSTIVVIDGLTRCGKSLFGPLLSSFERVEIERLEPEIEWIADTYLLGKIDEDAALTLLRLTLNRWFYEGMIGRNTNFRPGDHSSVWKAPRRFTQFKRLFLDERHPFVERVATERPIFQIIVHHQLVNLPLYQEAFGDRLRLLEIIKDPVELTASWMRKRKGELIGTDPLISLLFIEWNGRVVPWYVAGWEEEYLTSTPLDRVIRMIGVKWRLSLDAYRKMSANERKSVLMIPLEPFFQDPQLYLRELEKFIGTPQTRATPRALKAARCPRPYDRAARDAQLERYRREAGPAAQVVLEQIVHEHRTLLEEIVL